MATMGVMVTVTRVAGNKEGDGDGDGNNVRDGNGDKIGGRVRARRAMTMAAATM
jgi:hypothetical protein